MPSSKPRDTYLIPFPTAQRVPEGDDTSFDIFSLTSVFIPGYLIDYYNRRALIAVAAEMRNTEVSVMPVPVNESGRVTDETSSLLYLGAPDNESVVRLISEQVEISQFLRAGQDLVLSMLGRRVGPDLDADHPAILRHATLVLLLGELPP